jgi:hypothetical protein
MSYDSVVKPDMVYTRALEHLNKDVLRHLSTLKYLSLYRDHADVKLLEDSGSWAVMAKFPTSILSFDTVTYPSVRTAVFLNGTSNSLKHRLLSELTPDNYLLRLNENIDLSEYRSRYKISTGNVYISYTCSNLDKTSGNTEIPPNPEITPEAIDLFGRNDYTFNDLTGYFQQGAQWFGLTAHGQLVSACFIYQNYGLVWEIAGVHTIESERQHGYATIVVRSALSYLLGKGLIPRYDTNQQNSASHNLAHRLHLTEFLTIRHYLLEAR